jgi:hypothetical protein
MSHIYVVTLKTLDNPDIETTVKFACQAESEKDAIDISKRVAGTSTIIFVQCERFAVIDN